MCPGDDNWTLYVPCMYELKCISTSINLKTGIDKNMFVIFNKDNKLIPPKVMAFFIVGTFFQFDFWNILISLELIMSVFHTQ